MQSMYLCAHCIFAIIVFFVGIECSMFQYCLILCHKKSTFYLYNFLGEKESSGIRAALEFGETADHYMGTIQDEEKNRFGKTKAAGRVPTKEAINSFLLEEK